MSVSCTKCGSPIPEGFSFCGHCGTPFSSAPLPSAMPPQSAPPVVEQRLEPQSRVRIVVLRGPLPEGSVFDLQSGPNTIGREAEISFAADPSIDPEHLTIEVAGQSASLTAAPGYTGVFCRVKTPTMVNSGDIIFAGEQYLVVRRGDALPSLPVNSTSPAPDEVFGTPLPNPRLHVTQLLAGGIPGRVASTDKTVISVGRENCDLSFPQDRFMSGRHLRLELTGEQLTVSDVGSLNGTFTRAAQLPISLRSGDELMVGSVLFRVEIG
ncbi:MAG: hypothetical protein CMH53_03205 [Myxococcales bacterium]|nr:hypothetical protein [Myxococcales bacterium]